MSTHWQPNRREFLQLVAVAASGLVIGVPVARAGSRASAPLALHPLIHIPLDGPIVIYAKNPELGQGVKTALPMIVAEELGVDWSQLRIEQADYDPRLENQFAGGSLSVLLGYEGLRRAGAAARAMLVQAAAARWQVTPATCHAEHGEVVHADSGRRARYGELAAAAAQLPVPESPPLKAPEDFAIIGTTRSDPDLASIMRGELSYGIDQRLPDMVVASIERAPRFGARVKHVDSVAARASPGVVDVIVLDPDAAGGRLLEPNSPNFRPGVAVLARDFWSAQRGRAALKIEWDDEAASVDGADALLERFVAAVPGEVDSIRRDGDGADALAATAQRHEALYVLPFLAHVPMEPMNCVARVSDARVELWVPTQNPESIHGALSRLLPGREIEIHLQRAGGGFGRRYYVDYAVEAALLAQRAHRPVQVLWTREDDLANDYFRPGAAILMRAGLDEAGRVSAWEMRLANASRSTYLGRDDAPNGTEIDAYDFPAGLVPHLSFGYRLVDSQVPVGQWRAVASSTNVFATSSFLDELAHLAGRDPIDYFLDFIGPPRKAPVQDDFALDVARLRRVVDRVAELSRWREPRPPGRALGFAAAYTNTSFVAEVVEVEMARGGDLRVPRVYAAVDCGRVINPGGAEAQVQGAICEGLGAALHGAVGIAGGAVTTRNFDGYRLLRLADAPAIDIAFVGGDDAPRGLGEPALPPVAPALCNAVYAVAGRRIRRLPLGAQLGS